MRKIICDYCCKEMGHGGAVIRRKVHGGTFELMLSGLDTSLPHTVPTDLCNDCLLELWIRSGDGDAS